MNTYDLFTRYSRALVSKSVTRSEVLKATGVISKQRLYMLEKISFANRNYEFYKKLDSYLSQRGL